MKSIFKGEKNIVLVIILLLLLFTLWIRVLFCEIKREMYTENLDTLGGRINCVQSYGWIVDPGSELCEKLKLPDTFDDVYEKYNELQKASGFNLLKYRGKGVYKYTYIITNPPEKSKNIFYANILVYENSMIGGDVYTPAIDGLMLPIKRGSE